MVKATSCIDIKNTLISAKADIFRVLLLFRYQEYYINESAKDNRELINNIGGKYTFWGLTILLFRNQSPMVSARITTMITRKNCIETAVENTFLVFLLFTLSKFKGDKVLMDDTREPDIMENIATRPPTTLYIPKSSIPNAFRLTRLVYKLTSIKKGTDIHIYTGKS